MVDTQGWGGVGCRGEGDGCGREGEVRGVERRRAELRDRVGVRQTSLTLQRVQGRCWTAVWAAVAWRSGGRRLCELAAQGRAQGELLGGSGGSRGADCVLESRCWSLAEQASEPVGGKLVTLCLASSEPSSSATLAILSPRTPLFLASGAAQSIGRVKLPKAHARETGLKHLLRSSCSTSQRTSLASPGSALLSLARAHSEAL